MAEVVGLPSLKAIELPLYPMEAYTLELLNVILPVLLDEFDRPPAGLFPRMLSLA